MHTRSTHTSILPFSPVPPLPTLNPELFTPKAFPLNPRVFGGDRIKGLMVAFQIEDLPMESQMLTDALDTAQKRVESYFYDIRK
jgi:hypothetical protein